MATTVGDPVETAWQREALAALRELVEGQRQIIQLLGERHQRPVVALSRQDRAVLVKLQITAVKTFRG